MPAPAPSLTPSPRLTLTESIKAWCVGKTRWWRVLLLAGVVGCSWLILTDTGSPWNILDGANLLIHEAGHELWRWAGEWWCFAGGTLMQCLFPLLAAAELYIVQKDYFGVGLCVGWLAENLFEVARYMADARALNAPSYAALSWEAPDPLQSHDWRYLLGHAGLLAHDVEIAGVVRWVGIALLVACVIYSVWMLLYMEPKKEEDDVLAGVKFEGVDKKLAEEVKEKLKETRLGRDDSALP